MIEFMVRMYVDEDQDFPTLEKRFSSPLLPRQGEWLHMFGDREQDSYSVEEVHHDLVDPTQLPVVTCDSGVKGSFAKKLLKELKEDGWTEVKYE
jgi:hypothetical protein